MKQLITLLVCISVSFASFAQKSADLRLNLELNKKYKAKTNSVQSQKMTVQGMERSSDVTNTSYISIKPLTKTDEFYIAEVKIDSIITTNSMPPMNITSADKGDISSGDPVEVMKCILNRLSNSTFVVKMDFSGAVVDIMNYDVVAANILSGTDSLSGDAAMIKPQILTMVNKDSYKGTIETLTGYLPGKEVKKGEKWDKSTTVSSGGVGVTVNSSYTLKEISKEEILLNADVVIEPSSGGPMIMNGNEITSELRGIGKTELKIDPKTGWIIRSTSKSQMSGDMNIKSPMGEMQMPLEIISTTEVVNIQ